MGSYALLVELSAILGSSVAVAWFTSAPGEPGHPVVARVFAIALASAFVGFISGVLALFPSIMLGAPPRESPECGVFMTAYFGMAMFSPVITFPVGLFISASRLT